MRRRGFTLAELLVAMAVLAILGTALARLLLSNSRFVAAQEARLDARQTSRAAMNLLLADLRMVTAGGITVSRFDTLEARVPYAFGVLCGTSAGATIAALVPSDSVRYAGPPAAGVAVRGVASTFTFFPGVTASASAATSVCTADSIRVVPGGRLVALSATGLGPPGRVFYLYRLVRYWFGGSALLPGRRALWRQDGGGATEMLAPFAPGAAFWYLRDPNWTPDPTPNPWMVRGLELRLIAESEVIPPGAQQYTTVDLRPRVYLPNTEP